ncbi:MAG TPA: hypothetical protein VK634_19750 [Reyranella sp.]|nr:hypothetical protein [Reyranella sp.]HTE82930.1 hypothetical protein [Reyranella sp.]
MTDVVTLDMLGEMMRRSLDEHRLTREDVREIKRRLGIMEQHLLLSLGTAAGADGRIDNLSERVERIERRLELREG